MEISFLGLILRSARCVFISAIQSDQLNWIKAAQIWLQSYLDNSWLYLHKKHIFHWIMKYMLLHILDGLCSLLANFLLSLFLFFCLLAAPSFCLTLLSHCRALLYWNTRIHDRSFLSIGFAQVRHEWELWIISTLPFEGKIGYRDLQNWDLEWYLSETSGIVLIEGSSRESC